MVTMLSKQVSNNDNDDNGDDDDDNDDNGDNNNDNDDDNGDNNNNNNDDNGDNNNDNDDTSWWLCCRSSYRRRHRVWGQGVIQRCIEGLRLRLSIFVIMLFASVVHG